MERIMFVTGNEATHRAHSGNNLAFRRPSMVTFELDCPPRATHEEPLPITRATRSAAKGRSCGHKDRDHA